MRSALLERWCEPVRASSSAAGPARLRTGVTSDTSSSLRCVTNSADQWHGTTSALRS